MENINRAIAIVGNMAKLARLLGVTPQAVKFWREGRRRLPAEVCPLIERATSGAVTCEQLCPDVDWAYVRGTAMTPVGTDASDAEVPSEFIKPKQPQAPASNAVAAIENVATGAA